MIELPYNYIIAVDGHSSCGKSTLSKDIAKKLNLLYIDTGAMYRSVTLWALNNDLIRNGEIDVEKLQLGLKNIEISFKIDENGKNTTYLNGQNVEAKIREPRVASFVSPVSKLKFVREYLVAQQRLMSKKGRVILDGRDIGTVVFPHADLKIFLTASVDVRARRRYLEMKEKFPEITIDEVKNSLVERDRIDSNRKESPLKRAEDARILDNSNITREEQLNIVLKWIEESLTI